MGYLGNAPADQAVQIGDGVVDTDQLAAGAVTGVKIENLAVDTEHIAASAVETAKINADAVTAAKAGFNYAASGSEGGSATSVASGVGGSWIKLQSTTISSDTANVELESNIGSTYNHYMIVCSNVHCVSQSSNAAAIRLKLGGSYVGGSDYRYHAEISDSNTAYDNTTHAGDSSIHINWSIGNATGECTNLKFFFDRPSDTDNTKMIYWIGGTINDNGYVGKNMGCGCNMGTEDALTGFRFFFLDGNIASGIFTLYGLS